jgi:Domain of unknown function (DUF4124)
MRCVIFFFACCLAHPAAAEVFRCTLPDGKVEYQSTPCRVGKATPVRIDGAPPSDEGPAFPPRDGSQEPEIVGNARFQDRVREAMSLLKSRDGYTYSVVLGYVGKIEQAPHSGMSATSNPPTFHMSDATAMDSVSWAAAAIAHDAYHSKLYFDYRGSHPGDAVPNDAWGGTISEAKCTKFQVAAMRRFGAPQYQIDHALVNMDGHYIGQELSTRKW